MASRLLVVITRLAAYKDDQRNNEFTSLWQQEVARRWWAAPPDVDRRLVVLHGNATDYPGEISRLVDHATAEVNEAMREFGLIAGNPELGIAIHHSDNAVLTELLAAMTDRKPVFVMLYSDGATLFKSLASATAKGLGYGAAFDDVWKFFIDRMPARMYAWVGAIRHRIVRVFGSIVLDVKTMADCDFADSVVADVALGRATEPLPDLEEVRKLVHDGANSLRGIVSTKFQYDNEVLDAWADLAEAVRDDAIPLPEPVNGLLSALRDPAAIRRWKDAKPGQVTAVLAWWSTIQKGLDTLMTKLAPPGTGQAI